MILEPIFVFCGSVSFSVKNCRACYRKCFRLVECLGPCWEPLSKQVNLSRVIALCGRSWAGNGPSVPSGAKANSGRSAHATVADKFRLRHHQRNWRGVQGVRLVRLVIVFIISSLLPIMFFSAVIGLIMRKLTTGPKLVFFTVGMAVAASAALQLLDRSYSGAGGTFYSIFQDIVAALLLGITWLSIQMRLRREHK